MKRNKKINYCITELVTDKRTINLIMYLICNAIWRTCASGIAHADKSISITYSFRLNTDIIWSPYMICRILILLLKMRKFETTTHTYQWFQFSQTNEPVTMKLNGILFSTHKRLSCNILQTECSTLNLNNIAIYTILLIFIIPPHAL